MYYDLSRQIVTEGEEGYLNLLADVLKNGSRSGDRTGTGTIKVFGRMLRFKLEDGFPLLTTKRVWFKGILIELLWFISGSTNIRPLVQSGVHIWDEWPYQAWIEKDPGRKKFYTKGSFAWEQGLKDFVKRIESDDKFAEENGDLGAQAYGKVWRNFNGVDQLALAINMLRHNPNSRRILVSAWNPREVLVMPQGSLPPCHWSYQFAVDNDKLSILVNIRSWDTFLGGPFNIASYALLLLMVAQVTGLHAHEVVISSGDTHIYSNHLDAVETQLNRIPFPFPRVEINPDVRDIDDFQYDDFKLLGYEHHKAIKADISV